MATVAQLVSPQTRAALESRGLYHPTVVVPPVIARIRAARTRTH